ncbi:acyl-CoA dehydrogenase, partial [Halovibrio salipaludis]
KEGGAKERIPRGVYHTENPEDPVGRILHALRVARETEPARKRINDAIRKSDPDELQDIEMLLGHQREELLDWAQERDLLDDSERQKVSEAMAAMYDTIRVDAFSKESIEALAQDSIGRLELVERPKAEDEPTN